MDRTGIARVPAKFELRRLGVLKGISRAVNAGIDGKIILKFSSEMDVMLSDKLVNSLFSLQAEELVGLDIYNEIRSRIDELKVQYSSQGTMLILAAEEEPICKFETPLIF